MCVKAVALLVIILLTTTEVNSASVDYAYRHPYRAVPARAVAAPAIRVCPSGQTWSNNKCRRVYNWRPQQYKG